MTNSKTLKITSLVTASSLFLFGVCGTLAHAKDVGWKGKAEPPRYQEQIFPPWQHGANDPAVHQGFNFTVPEVDDLADFHGSLDHPRLTIFVGGNYYFAMAPLVKAFEKKYPALRGKIYYETLPPGILMRQIKAGGTITVGNMTWTIKPDVYAAGLKKVDGFIRQGILRGPAVPYVTNDLTIMIPKGNPAHIANLKDLGNPGVRLSMPNPAWEGVARQIKISLVKAGGTALEKEVYDTKVENGETILTHIHHRQTPLFLMQGLADAGVTWKSEAIFQEQVGHPIADVPIPAKDNTTAVYAAAVVKGAPHPKWAKAWIRFLRTPTALKIFEHYGFKPYLGK
jgi:ABC-type molybdate transport system substrate-binding protein